jgi:hypothetical protein
MKCSRCQKELPPEASVAAISGSISGDEVCDAFYFCQACGVYTVITWRDDFTGEESSTVRGPVPREEGDRGVALIRNCSTPWDKSCRCEAHVTYFRGTLD